MTTGPTRYPQPACQQLLQNFMPDIVGEIADVHIRTDANNLMATASTTRQPGQKEYMHLIRRKERSRGHMRNLAHDRSEGCLADLFTKNPAKPDELIKAVLVLIRHFGQCCRTKRFLCLARNTKPSPTIVAFEGVGLSEAMLAYFGTRA